MDLFGRLFQGPGDLLRVLRVDVVPVLDARPADHLIEHVPGFVPVKRAGADLLEGPGSAPADGAAGSRADRRSELGPGQGALAPPDTDHRRSFQESRADSVLAGYHRSILLLDPDGVPKVLHDSLDGLGHRVETGGNALVLRRVG